MPRVQVLADDGRPFLDERVRAADLASAHFARCLSERIAWAVEDAEQEESAPGPPALATAAA